MVEGILPQRRYFATAFSEYCLDGGILHKRRRAEYCINGGILHKRRRQNTASAAVFCTDAFCRTLLLRRYFAQAPFTWRACPIGTSKRARVYYDYDDVEHDNYDYKYYPGRRATTCYNVLDPLRSQLQLRITTTTPPTTMTRATTTITTTTYYDYKHNYYYCYYRCCCYHDYYATRGGALARRPRRFSPGSARREAKASVGIGPARGTKLKRGSSRCSRGSCSRRRGIV